MFLLGFMKLYVNPVDFLGLNHDTASDHGLGLASAFHRHSGCQADRPRALVLGLCAGSGFGVVEIGVRLIDVLDPTKRAFYTNPALYAAIAGGFAGFLLLTSALHRGSVTTAVAGMVVGETIAPAFVGVAWLGDTSRPGLGWLVVLGFVVTVAATLMLARFGEAPAPAEGDEAAA